jgi:hypothetical protein
VNTKGTHHGTVPGVQKAASARGGPQDSGDGGKKIKILRKELSFRLKGTEKGAAHRCRRPGTLRVHMALMVKARNAASGRDLGGVIAEMVVIAERVKKFFSYVRS